jgi:hypothetical protein
VIALALCALLAAEVAGPSATSSANGISLADYRGALASIAESLDAGDRQAAAEQALGLLGKTIDAPEGPLTPDHQALLPILDPSAPPHRARLQRLIDSLGGDADESRPTAPDKAQLDALRARQDGVRLLKGGEVRGLDTGAKSLLETFTNAVGDGFTTVWRVLKRIWRWLRRSMPGSDEKENGGSGQTNIFIFIATGFVIALVALLAIRARLSKGSVAPSTVPISRGDKEADEDPLSRNTSEWEQRARDLAAQGRAREAIRAWYHAVLVACYATGRLSHRRGRTNWEYAALLSPSLGWRPDFVSLTRWFDEQWYGRAESSDESLSLFSAGATGILRAMRASPR